jgi:GntR family transcriptional repressor for pyruvate dehydrogenase complex
VSSRRASEEVADEILAHMQSEGLRPGDRLGREQDLAERFGVSRPTLREALQALSAAHLIKASKGPGGGIFVAATPEEGIGHSVSAAVASMLKADSLSIEELVETRLLVEVPLAGLAAQRATDDDIARLEEAIEASSVALDGGGDIQEMDAAVHRMVAEIAGNRLAAAFTTWIVDVLQPSIHALVAQALVEQVVVEQHRDLLRAIARGEPSSAERAMREHLTYVADVIDAVRRSDDAAPPQ